jgi:hypothetical protein
MALRLSKPKQVLWVVSLVLGLLGLVGYLGVVPAFAPLSFWLMSVAWVLLLLGTAVRGM